MIAGHSLVCLLRSPQDSAEYVGALERVGFRAICVPVLQFAFRDLASLRALLEQPQAYGGLILTSPRAVEALAEALGGALPAGWTGKPAFAVGPRTAEAARALGLTVQSEEAGDADALADIIIAQYQGAPLLFLCGSRRRDVLPSRLAAAGMPLREVVVYETHLRDLDFGGVPAPDWLVFFSPSGVEAIEQARGIELHAPRIAAIGATTAAALSEAGFDVAAVAASPTPEALAEALRAEADQAAG